MKIPQNIPTITGAEFKYLNELLQHPGRFAQRRYMHACEAWLEQHYDKAATYMTTSGTRALELAAIAMGIGPGDEVIMPAYTFVSTANAFVLQGATPVFVDIHPETMNINESLVEDAITDRTKAIVAVHYAGVACELDTLSSIAKQHELLLLEDNAQGLMARYRGKNLGTYGHLSTLSFNYTKHLQAGEAGALVINDQALTGRTEVAYEAGTNRREFLRKEASFYEWKGLGSKFFPSEMINAFILGQLELAESIVDKRKEDWQKYITGLTPLRDAGHIDLPYVPSSCEHNAHIFYIKTKDEEQRKALTHFLKESDIYASFHYVPLHRSAYGQQVSRFHGEDRYTSRESERLLRLPIYQSISAMELDRVVDRITEFYSL